MKALIGCEESQAVTIALREKGVRAYSCDLQDCSGGHPEWHIKGDIMQELPQRLLSLNFLGFHPVCQYLTNAGVRWLASKKPRRGYEWSEKYQIHIDWKRYSEMEKAAYFFKSALSYVKTVGCGYLENPIMHKYAMEIIKEPPTQIIQPYEFGHPESKATCLWLVGLPKLKETDNVKELWKSLPKNKAQRLHYLPPGPDRAKIRSKTYPGIAEAIASQWCDYILHPHIE